MPLFKMFIAVLVLLATQLASATERVHYRNEPVTVRLTVGQERTIQFGDHVQVGINRAQQSQNLFRVQSAQGAIHIRANVPFQAQRLQVKRLGDGRVVLLDLVASAAEASEPLENIHLYMPDEDTVADVARSEAAAAAPTSAITAVTLTRYAAQQLYGPSRLHTQIAGINALTLGPVGDSDIRLFKGLLAATTTARPFVAYKGGAHHLAGILITNTSDRPVTLDYMALNVPFSHATFQHHRLAPAGEPADRTVLYLVTDQSLAETLVPWDFYSIAATTTGAGEES